MYDFQRRLNSVKKLLNNFENTQSGNNDLARDELEIFITHARTITFVMQKELSKFSGFNEWYGTKQAEMAKKYKYFIDIRNKIEKEGSNPMKSIRTVVGFAPHFNATQKIGIKKYPNGRVEDVMGEINHTRYFDAEGEKEILSSSKDYLNYLDGIVSEAVSRFLETR